MTVCQYLPLCWIRLLPKVNVEEGIYALHFYGCKKVYKSWLSFLETLPNLIDTLLHSCQLEGYCYDCLWHGHKGTWYRKTSSAYHHWPELWHYIWFVQSEEAFTVKRKKHANTHIHTTHTQLSFCSTICSWLIWNCVKAVESCPFIFDFVADWCETQELCDKVVSKDIFMLKYYTDRYKTQKRCDNTVDSFLAILKFVPDWFFRNKVTKKLDGYS